MERPARVCYNSRSPATVPSSAPECVLPQHQWGGQFHCCPTKPGRGLRNCSDHAGTNRCATNRHTMAHHGGFARTKVLLLCLSMHMNTGCMVCKVDQGLQGSSSLRLRCGLELYLDLELITLLLHLHLLGSSCCLALFLGRWCSLCAVLQGMSHVTFHVTCASCSCLELPRQR
jgi:hypothetical protein